MSPVPPQLAEPRKGSSDPKALEQNDKVKSEKWKVKRKNNKKERNNREIIDGDTAEKEKFRGEEWKVESDKTTDL